MKWNESVFDELGRSAPVVNVLVDKGDEIAGNARAFAPVDSGEYLASITVTRRSAAHREVVVVTADAPHAAIVESRNGVLAKALRAASG
jgi:hypothetical protein